MGKSKRSRSQSEELPSLVILQQVADGDLDAVHRYLTAGRDPNIAMRVEGHGAKTWRPLNAAVTAHYFSPSHLEIVRLLLAHGAVVDREVLNDFVCEGMFAEPHEVEAFVLLRAHASPELQLVYADLPPGPLLTRIQKKKRSEVRGRLSLCEHEVGALSVSEDHGGALSPSSKTEGR